MTMVALRWIGSLGGPLILIGAENLNAWEGSDPPSGGRVVEASFRWRNSPNDPATDYDRACDIKDYIGSIAVGEGQGLVLGDAPYSTSWWPSNDAEGMIIRRVYEPEWLDKVSDIPATWAKLLGDLPEDVWQIESFSFPVQEKLTLFDSVGRGDRIGTQALIVSLDIELSAGTYEIATAVGHPEEEIELTLHRFRRTGP